MLASCNSFIATPTLSQADIMQTAISTVSTSLAETQWAIPTATPSLLPLPTVSFLTSTPFPVPSPLSSSTALVFTDPSVPLSERIVYYYFVSPAENPIPERTIRWGGLLAPTYADEAYTSDTAADLRTALGIVLQDGRNYWESDQLEIVDVTFGNGRADIVLQGEYFGLGDGVLCAASLQILFTVFANPAVQTSTVTLNGGLIGNLCLFGPPTPHSDDYLNDSVYTRTEIETFMKENAYVSP